LIVLGVFQLIIVVLGFIGTIKKKQGLVIAYLVIMCILIVCEWGVGGGAYALAGDIDQKLTAQWDAADLNDKNNIQKDFTCCGWANTTQGYWNGSICDGVTDQPTCKSKLVDAFQSKLSLTGAIGITFATLQLIGVVATGIVLGCIQQEERYKKFSTMS